MLCDVARPRRARGLIVLALMALSLTLVCVLAARSLRAVDDSLQAVARTEYAQAQLVDVDEALSDLVALAGVYAITPDESLYAQYRRLGPRIDATLDRLDALVPAPGLTRFGVDALAALARDREQFAAGVIQAARAGDPRAAQRLLAQARPKSNVSAVRATVGALQTEGRRALSLDRAAIGRARLVFLISLWASGAVAVVLLAAVTMQLLGAGRHHPSAHRFGGSGTVPVD